MVIHPDATLKFMRISQRVVKLLFCLMILNIIILKSLPHISGANQLHKYDISCNSGIAWLIT